MSCRLSRVSCFFHIGKSSSTAYFDLYLGCFLVDYPSFRTSVDHSFVVLVGHREAPGCWACMCGFRGSFMAPSVKNRPVVLVGLVVFYRVLSSKFPSFIPSFLNRRVGGGVFITVLIFIFLFSFSTKVSGPGTDVIRIVAIDPHSPSGRGSVSCFSSTVLSRIFCRSVGFAP